jgi:hypothetical protein
VDVGKLLMKLTNTIQNAYALDLEKDAKNKEYVSTDSSSCTAGAASRSLRSVTSAVNQSQQIVLDNIKRQITTLHDSNRIVLLDWLLPFCPPIPLEVNHAKEEYDLQNKWDLEARLSETMTKFLSNQRQNLRLRNKLLQLKQVSEENGPMELQSDAFGGSDKTRNEDPCISSTDMSVTSNFSCFHSSTMWELPYESFIRYNPVRLFKRFLHYLSPNATQAARNVIQAIQSAVNLSPNIPIAGVTTIPTGLPHIRANLQLHFGRKRIEILYRTLHPTTWRLSQCLDSSRCCCVNYLAFR